MAYKILPPTGEETDVMAGSRIVISETTKPSRIVLRKLSEAKYVTHLEVLKPTSIDGEGTITFAHEGYSQGSYFERCEDPRKAAIDDFNDRCSKL